MGPIHRIDMVLGMELEQCCKNSESAHRHRISSISFKSRSYGSPGSRVSQFVDFEELSFLHSL